MTSKMIRTSCFPLGVYGQESFPIAVNKEQSVIYNKLLGETLNLAQYSAKAVNMVNLRSEIKFTPRVGLNETGAYLGMLRRGIWRAFFTMVLSVAVIIAATIALFGFTRAGITFFVHPLLSVFIILWAVGLLTVASISAISIKQKLEKFTWTLLKSCYEH